MTAPKSSTISSFEPQVKLEGTLGQPKPKKHVTIKMEPEHIGKSGSFSSSSKSSTSKSSSNSVAAGGNHVQSKIPITPNEKILQNPNLKSIDNNINISKFYIQPQGIGKDANGDFSDETPTKSNSKKHEQKRVDKPSLKRSVSSNQVPKISTTTATGKTKILEDLSPIIIKKQKLLPKPTPLKPIEESIITNADGLNLEQIFQSINEDSIKLRYMNYSSLEFEEWSSRGMNLINSQYDIVKKIIVSRTKLNLKFKLIFGLINKYGEGLEGEDLVLKEKMNKLENLGQEIRSFIS